MNKTYHYVVLRLAADQLRGEVINVGAVLFTESEQPKTIMMATLNKLRAIDASWDSARLSRWALNIQGIVEREGDKPSQLVKSLGRFGFCDPEAVGMFSAGSQTELNRQLQEIKYTYVANKAREERETRTKRTRLQKALRDQFSNMHVLGQQIDDLANHLVVANVPVPDYPDLRTDFVYKNGCYRITQTIDYHVSPGSIHNKLAEACIKSTAAQLATSAWGKDTMRLAVVDIPDEFIDQTDDHLDLLMAQGFEVFHFGVSADMDRYMSKALPAKI